MTDKVKMAPVWQPTKAQRKWLDKKAAENKRFGKSGGIGQVMRDLVQNQIDGDEL